MIELINAFFTVLVFKKEAREKILDAGCWILDESLKVNKTIGDKIHLAKSLKEKKREREYKYLG